MLCGGADLGFACLIVWEWWGTGGRSGWGKRDTGSLCPGMPGACSPPPVTLGSCRSALISSPREWGKSVTAQGMAPDFPVTGAMPSSRVPNGGSGNELRVTWQRATGSGEVTPDPVYCQPLLLFLPQMLGVGGERGLLPPPPVPAHFFPSWIPLGPSAGNLDHQAWISPVQTLRTSSVSDLTAPSPVFSQEGVCPHVNPDSST